MVNDQKNEALLSWLFIALNGLIVITEYIVCGDSFHG